MKQYTTKDQTAKLMELGFPKPNSIESVDIEFDDAFDEHTIYNLRYSIGELIEFLPHSYSKNDKYFRLDIFPARSGWFVLYNTLEQEESHRIFKRELVDALFETLVTLKEEGLI